VAGAALLHLQVASTGWLFRYEAYLLMLGIAALGAIAATWSRSITRHASFSQRVIACVLLAIAGFPFVSRGWSALGSVSQATSNIYHQQYQMALFLARFYSGRTVALNDIGVVDFLADVRLFDIYGLGSLAPARLRLQGSYRAATIAALAAAQGVEIAVIYPAWLGDYGGIPATWTNIGEWEVHDNIILGGNVVSFYAVSPAEKMPLAE